jgi:hypothetical protein
VNIPLFTHALLKIAFAVILAISIGAVSELDLPVRAKAAQLLKLVCNRSQVAFPGIITVVVNRLIGALFDMNVSLRTHIGAIMGIDEFGQTAVTQLAPHLLVYAKFLLIELRSSDPEQKMLAHMALDQLQNTVEISEALDDIIDESAKSLSTLGREFGKESQKKKKRNR